VYLVNSTGNPLLNVLVVLARDAKWPRGISFLLQDQRIKGPFGLVLALCSLPALRPGAWKASAYHTKYEAKSCLGWQHRFPETQGVRLLAREMMGDPPSGYPQGGGQEGGSSSQDAFRKSCRSKRSKNCCGKSWMRGFVPCKACNSLRLYPAR
jgi:hypothetical protein